MMIFEPTTASASGLEPVRTAPVRVSWQLATCLACLTLHTPAAHALDAPPPSGRDDGFVYSLDLTLDDDWRMRAAGPFYERETATNGATFRGLRPFYSVTTDVTGTREVRDFLWPLGYRRQVGDEVNWRYLLAYGVDFDITDPESHVRNRVFPLWYSGRDKHGETYHALFPLGGSIHEFLFRDEIDFVLFPLYAHTVVNDFETRHVLWPIVAWSRGGADHGFRVFPLYGESIKPGRTSHRFVLWPFWTSARYEEPVETGSSYILFPLYGRVQTTKQTGWMFLPPFFRWSHSDKRTELNAPWPIVQYSDGDVDKFYLWPLWGRRHQAHIDKAFYVWPIVHTLHVARADGAVNRCMVLPFWYSETAWTPTNPVATNAVCSTGAAATNQAPSVRARYRKLWPLWTYRREDDVSSFQVLALWPLKDTRGIERNYAPIWTLYAHQRAGAALDEELLWGLWRRQRDAEGNRHVSIFPLFSADSPGAPEGRRRWSALFGLVSREREGLNSRTRVLYIFSHSSKAQSTVAVPPASPGDSSEQQEPIPKP